MLKKVLIVIAFFSFTAQAQVKEYEVGAKSQYRQTQGGFFDYSDPASINMTVSVWGFVKYPGKYVVPVATEVVDLLSYAGGPTDAASLDDLRIYRKNDDGTEELIKFNYNDLMWDDDFKPGERHIPHLQAGDVLIAAGSPRYYFRDYFSMSLQIISTLITLTLFIINITSNK